MLPNNKLLEQGLLGAIAFDNEIMNKIKIEEKDFYNNTNKTIFLIFKALFDNGKPIDIIFFRSFIEIKKIDIDPFYFTDLIDACSHSGLWKDYERELIRLTEEREMLILADNVKYKTSKGEIEEARKLIENIPTRLEQKKGNNVYDLVNSFGDYLEQIKKQGALGTPGPYKILDKDIGGIIEGKVYTIVAYSGVGKSNFSYEFINNELRKGNKVIVFSLEVQKELLFGLLLKNYYGITQKELFKDNFYYDIENFKNLIVYDDVYGLEEIKNIVKVEKPQFVCIDFIQNIKTEGGTEYEKMTNVAQELQKLAINTKTTIMNISQANNDSRFKNSGGIQPKGSGAIFASSDIILALSRDGQNLELNLLKNKYGPSDKKYLLIPDFPKCKFKISNEIFKEKDDFKI